MLVKIRFNTEWEKSPGGEYKWRLLIDGREELAKSITIRAPCFTTEDVLPDGRRKWHVTADSVRVLARDGHFEVLPAEA